MCLAIWPGVRGHRIRCTSWLPLATRARGQADGGRPWPGCGVATFGCDACCWPMASSLTPRLPLPPCCAAAPPVVLLILSRAAARGAVPRPPTHLAAVAFVPSRTTYLPSLSSVSYVVYYIVMSCCCVRVAARGHTFNGSVQALTDVSPAPCSCGHIPALSCLIGSWPCHLYRGRFPRCGGGSTPLSLALS